METIRKTKVGTGIYWIEIPETGLKLLCGCPADSVKHLMKKGFIKIEEKNGVSLETGPNAILLSDVLIQNGHFSNLSEFPVLQMLYRQGMIIPNHPNNTGRKPILVGSREQALSQMRYIYRGNYGLISEQEILNAGISPVIAREMMRIKTKFAFGKIKPSREFLDVRVVEKTPAEIVPGVFIKRVRLNEFEIRYKEDSVEVDLNIPKDHRYEIPYPLSFHNVKREYFAVLHSGEGDGWDVNRPCMASILMYQGKVYLIDAGPNILGTLVALGFNISEVEGIFHTHSHDDHFAGLPSLIRSDHRLKYYATPLVRMAVTKKLTALIGIDEDHVSEYFEFHDLQFDVWNDIDGLEVKPLYSPHPVENNVFVFRTLWEDGYRSYAHFADIIAMDVFGKMLADDPQGEAVSKDYFDKINDDYLQPYQLKKLDMGGGMIHGKAVDFKEDKSGKIILSHTAAPLKDSEKEIGSEATFGTVDVLIPCSQSYSRRYAFEYLHSYFPEIPLGQIRILLNNSIIDFNPGTILQKEGDPILNVYLVLTGNVEMIQSKLGIHHAVSSGELVGEIPIMIDESSYVTFRAVSFVQALKIPRAMFLQFIKNNGLHEGMKKLQEARRFLRNTPLFGEALSYPVQNSVARSMSLNRFEKKTEIGFDDATFLYVIKSGELECYIGNDVFETLKSGDFFGQERAIFKTQCLFHIRTLTEVEVYQIPGKVLKDIPVVHWKLFEAYEKRLRLLDSTLTGVSLFQWRDEYSVQVHKMDKQHQKLFSIGEKLSSAIDSTNMKPMIERALEFLVDYTKVHLTEEEALMALYNYPELDSHRKKHKKLTEQVLELQAQYKKDSVKLDATFFDFFRDWIITHILAEDRKYSGFLNSKGVH